jgi:formate dehydrogenase gamma subunit
MPGRALGGLLSAILAAGLCLQALAQTAADPKSTLGVCPPFFLRTETGEIIDPPRGLNADQPYSPRQTCGFAGCHDYAKITEGYHFTQGAGEYPTENQRRRILWASSPGNFGGSWCSPAPLYPYLSPKKNESAATMDLTAFSFLTSPCGACHPGGGSAEYDREGKRYDHWMADPESGLSPGADNRFDGDYHRAHWSRSGVLEADCLLCHAPGYDYAERSAQIADWNFRWAATAGAGWAEVTGAVKDGEAVEAVYDTRHFQPDGTIRLQLIRSPRNEACLNCHAQPGWKKRGSNFRARTDVHLRAELRCVDCHLTGGSALDPRIAGREIHHIGKGDDPGGLVRNDLDDTMLTCTDCHYSGRLGAPIPTHRGLPPLHMETIACQTCHIPERLVMPTQVQAGDVFNDAPWIPGSGKKLWTFYGPDGAFRNHYGFIEVMGYDDKPTERFRPELVRYKGKIFPVNRVHSAWPAIEIEGESALMQPRMRDIFGMWSAHRADPARYPELATIRDDTGDGVPEVNRPEEIDALIAAVGAMLDEIGYPMEGKRVVWALNDRVYRSGTEYRLIEKEDWEASPYGNVHKYSHDIAPARAALGAGGCADCHSRDSWFFHQSVLEYPFSPDGSPVRTEQWRVLGLTRAEAGLGAWRETRLKPFAPWLFGLVFLLALIHLVVFGRRTTPPVERDAEVVRYELKERLAHLFAIVPFTILAITGFCFLLGARDPLGPGARSVHAAAGFVFSAGILLLQLLWARDARFSARDRRWLRNLGGYFGDRSGLESDRFNGGQKLFFWTAALFGLGLGVSGTLMWLRDLHGLSPAILYTLHDLLAVGVIAMVMGHLYLAVVVNPGAGRAIIDGKVSRSWAEHHHPNWIAPMSTGKCAEEEPGTFSPRGRPSR